MVGQLLQKLFQVTDLRLDFTGVNPLLTIILPLARIEIPVRVIDPVHKLVQPAPGVADGLHIVSPVGGGRTSCVRQRTFPGITCLGTAALLGHFREPGMLRNGQQKAGAAGAVGSRSDR